MENRIAFWKKNHSSRGNRKILVGKNCGKTRQFAVVELFSKDHLEGLLEELSEEELGDDGADKGGGNLLLGMAPEIKISFFNGHNFHSFKVELYLEICLCYSSHSSWKTS